MRTADGWRGQTCVREVTGGDRETDEKLKAFLANLERGGFFQGLDRTGGEYAERRRKAIDKFVQKHGVRKAEARTRAHTLVPTRCLPCIVQCVATTSRAARRERHLPTYVLTYGGPVPIWPQRRWVLGALQAKPPSASATLQAAPQLQKNVNLSDIIAAAASKAYPPSTPLALKRTPPVETDVGRTFRAAACRPYVPSECSAVVCPRQVASTISTVGSPAAGAGWERSAVASRFLEEVCIAPPRAFVGGARMATAAPTCVGASAHGARPDRAARRAAAQGAAASSGAAVFRARTRSGQVRKPAATRVRVSSDRHSC